jgi:pseudouridine kinase
LSKPANKARRDPKGRGAPFVVVVGGANIDIKVAIDGKVVPATSNPGKAVVTSGGVGRNIAHNLARLGLAVRLISVVGRDAEGDRLLEETAAAGVDVTAVKRGRGNTGLYSAILDRGGELVIGVSAMDVIAELNKRDLEHNRTAIERAAFVVADCNLDPSTLGWLHRRTAESNVPFMIEPVSAVKAKKVLALLKRSRPIHTITPNLKQLEVLSGHAITGLASARRAAAALRSGPVSHVLVGLGPDGALLSSKIDGEIVQHHVPAMRIRPKDVTGGGDALVAGYVSGIVRGRTPLEAVLLGQAAAAFAVESAETVSARMDFAAVLKRAGTLKRRAREF